MVTDGRHHLRRAFAIIASLLLGVSAMAAPAPPGEYDVKAAFLFNFAKFVTWPPQAFSSADDPIVLGVLGEDPFGSELARLAAGVRVQGRSISILRGSSAAQLARCHIVFISSSERGRLRQIVQALHEAGSSALTVGESDNFLDAGGMVRFVLEQNKVRFAIRPEPAVRVGLTISSKLLSLAVNSRRT